MAVHIVMELCSGERVRSHHCQRTLQGTDPQLLKPGFSVLHVSSSLSRLS